MAISLEDSMSILLEKIKLQKKTHISLEDCYNRVLAEDIIADMDFPPFDRSPLDGYAVRMEDVQSASSFNPVVLKQVDYVPAGSWPSKKVEIGMATRIMTGAKIPEGADAIIRLEDTEVQQDMVSIFAAADANHNICRQGEEICIGQIMLKKGTVIKDGAMGVLAMLGRSRPLIYEQPKVAILATGTEIVSVDQPLTKGKIRNSNSYMLMAKVREAGGQPILLGQVKDDIIEMEKKLIGHENIAMYITTGGASVGDYDLMEQLFHKMKIPMLFSRLAMKPGMPVITGFWHDTLVVALSGNPASANVSFEVLLRPLLRKMAGIIEIERPRAEAKLKKAFNKKSKSRRFIWARCENVDGALYAEPIDFQGNGMLSGLLPANALIDVSADSSCLPIGTRVTLRLLTD
ncbi:gephyrin-like molybdotransferase Glp [Pelosinus sp. UFO1]|uniref:molybdopterin molybdotransferase MoeA n=1 Tax=Pelosinus sp. UFO1 TaxID=484770 RepID=UPI0004D0E92A|nr:gephyrin-like molybdotransferase Glp [Pelosinus sp. UFO1]AIF51102.1 MoeA domain protein domain I and II [Pelosinus sp. UFO1]